MNRSVMPPQKNFAKFPQIDNIQRSVFNRSHGHKSTFDSGFLVPFFVDEILPGDTQDVKANIFARLSSALDFPIMDNIFLDTFFFFVPNRLLWDNWEKFMGSQVNPSDSIDYVIPTVNMPASPGFAVGSLYDYFGIPTNVWSQSYDDVISNLPARAYNLIWNEWFRDENLQQSVVVDKGDGPDDEVDYQVLRRNKRHDYFTSCLPWPQKGDAVQAIPGAAAYDANVIGNGKSLGLWDNAVSGSNYGGIYYDNATTPNNINKLRMRTTAYNVTLPTTVANSGAYSQDLRAVGVTPIVGQSGMIAQIGAQTAVTINQLREAFAIQQFLELNARSGTRYVEILRAQFGVTIPDFRLQRPEYLGGGSQMVNINPIHQTTFAATPTMRNGLGAQAAFATMNSRSGFSKSFVEHGYVIGLVNVRADITYQQGINKMWLRKTRYDFYNPVFANLGEQAVKNIEIYFQDNVIDPDTFGYQERWAEYRYLPSRISGKLRSTASGTLDAWHLSQKFTSVPLLNTTFILDNPPLARVLTVDTEPQVIFDSFIEVKHARPMPVYSVPGLKRL